MAGLALVVCLWAAAPARGETPARFERDPNWVAGQAALRDGFHEVARQKFEAFVAKAFFKASKAQGTLYAAQALFAQGRHAEVVALLRERRGWASKGDVEGGFVYWTARAQFELGEFQAVTQTLHRFEREYREDPDVAQVARLRTHALMRLGEREAALRSLAQFQERYPGAPEVPDNLLDWAGLLLEDNRLEDAERLLRQIIEQHGGHESAQVARLWLGRLLVDRGDFAGASTLLDPLTRAWTQETEPDTHAEAWLAVAGIAVAQTNFPAALDAYERGERTAEELGLKLELRIARARLLARTGQADAALKLLAAAVESAPAHPGAGEAQLALADIQLEQSLHAAALESYQRYLAAYADEDGQARARLGRGWALWRLARYAEAAEVFEQAAPLQTDPARREQAMVKAADAYFANGQYKLAEAAYRRVLEAYPASALSPQVLLQLAESLARGRDYAGAETALRDLRARFPADPLAVRAVLRSAALCEEQGQWAAAVALYDEALARAPGAGDRAEALLRAGLASYRGGEFQQALDRFERVLREFADTAAAESAFHLRGRALHLLGQTQRGLQIAQQFLDRFPASAAVPEVRFWMAEQQFNAGAFGAAETNFAGVAAAFPLSEWADDALYWAGRAAVAQGEYRRALGVFNELTRTYTNSPLVPDARFAQGDALAELGEYAGALLAFDDIVRRFPSHALADRARGRQGDCQFMLGADRPERYQEAIASYRTVLDGPATPMALRLQASFKIGRCFERLGRGADAFRYYLDTVYGWLAERAEGRFVEPVWFVRAAFAGAALKEAERQWDEAIRMYERVVEAGLPAGADAEKRIQKIHGDRAALLRDAPAGSTSR
ncbi:MAG TPA: tetratricopeptide repeat protein [Kiritimatiellia bacterium]|nr:tetratricopeptide repeat protein [Kiritimatiellia bacterium]